MYASYIPCLLNACNCSFYYFECNLAMHLQTMAGPVLLAINPFKDVSVSGSDVIMAYREKILDSPHVYAVSDAAYNDMMRGEFDFL